MKSSQIPMGILFCAACSCTGSVGDPPATVSASGSPPLFSLPGSGQDPVTGAALPPRADGAVPGAGVGPMPLRRLTSGEFLNTVRDLFGDSSIPPFDLPGDEPGSSGFVSAGLVTTDIASRLLDAAEQIASKQADRLSSIVPCDKSAAEDACARTFIDTFAPRAFRRPLVSGESDQLFELYSDSRSKLQYDFRDAMRVLLSEILQDASFLYHWELGPVAPKADGVVIELTPYELASRLSYFLWQSMPDAELSAAAKDGRLSAPADVAEQVTRMLGDVKAKRALDSFVVQWLRLSRIETVTKDPKTFPEWQPDLAAALRDETLSFFENWAQGGTGTLSSLLTGTTAFPSDALAALYGQGAPGSGSNGSLDPHQRPGILTRGAFLAVQASAYESHPVKRGKAVWEQLVCGSIPAPPANVPAPTPPAPNLSTRQRFAEHSQNACARACHSLMDPLGFAFENYDAIGRFRTEDGGKPVDASGSITLPAGDAHDFANAEQLMQVLSASKDVQACQEKQWFRFALSRGETQEDLPSLQEVYSDIASRGLVAHSLIEHIATSRTFAFRSVAAGESTQ